MNKLLIAVCLSSALALAAHAAEGEGKKKSSADKPPTPAAEKKAIRKELTEKYDTNKSGKLDKEERAKMTPEDLEKWTSSATPKKKDAAAAPEAGKK